MLLLAGVEMLGAGAEWRLAVVDIVVVVVVVVVVVLLARVIQPLLVMLT